MITFFSQPKNGFINYVKWKQNVLQVVVMTLHIYLYILNIYMHILPIDLCIYALYSYMHINMCIYKCKYTDLHMNMHHRILFMPPIPPNSSLLTPVRSESKALFLLASAAIATAGSLTPLQEADVSTFQ